MDTTNLTTRVCKKCKITKPLDDFPFREKKGRENALSPYTARRNYCRKCDYQRSKAYPYRQRAWNARRSAASGLTGSELQSLAERSPNCYLCGDSLPWNAPKNIELDHVVPKSKGGTNVIENVRWTHRACNRMKHDYTLDEFKVVLAKILHHL